MRTLVVILMLVVGSLSAPSARADDFEQALAAHEALELEAALEHARAAVAAGTSSPARLAEAYLLIGRCHASLRQAEEARQAFIRALALAPGIRLSALASPVETSPFMEARGFWLDYAKPLALDVSVKPDGWSVRVMDPAGMGERIAVVEEPGQKPLAFYDADHGRAVQVPSLVQGRHVVLFDEAGNSLASAALPVILTQAASKAVRSAAPSLRGEKRGQRLRQASRVQLGLGLTSAVVGYAMDMRRRRLLDLAEAPECQPASACPGIGAQTTRAERSAYALYALGGAALASGLTTWTIALRRERRDRRAVACGVQPFGAMCRARF